MSKKSIAQTILDDLKKQEMEKDKEKREICLNFMQNIFDRKITLLDNSANIIIEKKDLPTIFKTDTFLDALSSLGFDISKYGVDKFLLSVPAHIKGHKLTEAQSMLRSFNAKLNKAKDEANRLAVAEVDRVWDCIKNHDFESEKISDNVFQLKIALTENRGGKICNEKLCKYLSCRAFHNTFIAGNTLFITLGEETSKI